MNPEPFGCESKALPMTLRARHRSICKKIVISTIRAEKYNLLLNIKADFFKRPATLWVCILTARKRSWSWEKEKSSDNDFIIILWFFLLSSPSSLPHYSIACHTRKDPLSYSTVKYTISCPLFKTLLNEWLIYILQWKKKTFFNFI